MITLNKQYAIASVPSQDKISLNVIPQGLNFPTVGFTSPTTTQYKLTGMERNSISMVVTYIFESEGNILKLAFPVLGKPELLKLVSVLPDIEGYMVEWETIIRILDTLHRQGRLYLLSSDMYNIEDEDGNLIDDIPTLEIVLTAKFD